MDGEPGFAEQGGESKPDRAKNGKTHRLHPQRGVISFGYFSLDKQRKVSRLSHAVAGESFKTKQGFPFRSAPKKVNRGCQGNVDKPEKRKTTTEPQSQNETAS